MGACGCHNVSPESHGRGMAGAGWDGVRLRGLRRIGAMPSMSLEGTWCGEGLRVW